MSGGMAERLRESTALMASYCQVHHNVWQEHSTAVLQAADALVAKDGALAKAERFIVYLLSHAPELADENDTVKEIRAALQQGESDA